MDIFTFLIILAFFVTVIALVAIVFGQTKLAEIATTGLIKLSRKFIPKTTQQNSDDDK